AKLQPLPKGGKPITKWSNQNEAFMHVTEGIRKAVIELRSKLRGRGRSVSLQESEPAIRYVNMCVTRYSDQTVVPKTVNLEGGKEYALRIDIGQFSSDSVVENTEMTVHPAELLVTTEVG